MRDKDLNEMFNGAEIVPDEDAKERAKARMLTQAEKQKNNILGGFNMKTKFKITKQHWQGAAAMLLVCVIAVSAMSFMPGVNLFGTLAQETTMPNDRSAVISDPLAAFDAIDKYGKLHYARYSDKVIKSTPSHPVSHVQSYARYRVSNDRGYHIYTHSNVSGQAGYLYIAMEQQPSVTFTMEVVDPSQVDSRGDQLYPIFEGKHYNHPGGMQIIGDYLVIAVVPATSAGIIGGRPKLYSVDLTPLKQTTPSQPTEIKEIRVPGIDGFDGARAVGVMAVKEDVGKNGYVGATSADTKVRFMISVHTGKTNHVFLSDPTTRFSQATNYKDIVKLPTYDEHNYETIGLFADKQGKIFMLGFCTSFNGTDKAHLYQWTDEKGKFLEKDALKRKNHDIKTSTSGKTAIHFEWGAGFEIKDDRFIIYATDKSMGNDTILGYKATRINIFSAPVYVDIEEGWYTIETDFGFPIWADGKNKGDRLVLGGSNDKYADNTFYISRNIDIKNGHKIMAGSTAPKGIDNKYLEEGSFNNNLQLYTWSSSNKNKTWMIEEIEPGLFTMRNASTNKYISYEIPYGYGEPLRRSDEPMLFKLTRIYSSMQIGPDELMEDDSLVMDEDEEDDSFVMDEYDEDESPVAPDERESEHDSDANTEVTEPDTPATPEPSEAPEPDNPDES